MAGRCHRKTKSKVTWLGRRKRPIFFAKACSAGHASTLLAMLIRICRPPMLRRCWLRRDCRCAIPSQGETILTDTLTPLERMLQSQLLKGLKRQERLIQDLEAKLAQLEERLETGLQQEGTIRNLEDRVARLEEDREALAVLLSSLDMLTGGKTLSLK